MTLVELTLALAILSIGILGVCSMQLSSTRGNAAASHLTDLGLIASRISEKLYGYDFKDERISGDPNKNPHVPDPSTDGIDNDWDGIVDPDPSILKEGAGLVSVTWVVEDNLPIANVKTITVTVKGEPVSGPKEVSVKFYKGDLI